MYGCARNDGLGKNKELGSSRMKSNKIHLSVEIQPLLLYYNYNVCPVTELDVELEIREIILPLNLGSLFPCVVVPRDL